MKELIEAVTSVQTATWIAIASLAVSIAVLAISNRRLSFDTRLIGAKKATEIRGLFLEYKRRIEKFLHSLDAWERVCKDCEFYPKQNFVFYRQSAEAYGQIADAYLQTLARPVTEETAIVLEPITAYGDDLCKRLDAMTELCRKLTPNCFEKKAKALISDQNRPSSLLRRPPHTTVCTDRVYGGSTD